MSPQQVVPPPRPKQFLKPPPVYTGSMVPQEDAGNATFWICAVYTFLLFSRMVEFIDNHGRMHLAFLSGAACILALLSTGNLPKMFISRQGRWITLFCFWIFAGLPFSTWKGGSTADFQSGWIKSYMTFFIVGGLIFSLKQFRLMTLILAFSTVGQIYLAFHSGVQDDNRLTMSYGSLGNSNDLATALLMGLPFMLLHMTDRKTNALVRVTFIPLTIMLLIAVMKTGSRGGLIAIGCLTLFNFFRVSAQNKLKIAVGAIFIVGLFATVVPSSLKSRYMTIFKTNVTAATTDQEASALDSSNARKELFTNTFILTLRHPIFGVGLAQFSAQSFNLFIERGIPGMWFTSHDIFALVASEIGIPGLIFFCGLIVCSFRVLSRLAKLPPTTPEVREISRLAYAVMMSLLAYVACGVFNTDAYSHQLPVLAALSAALERIAQPYLAAAANVPPPLPWSSRPFVHRRLGQPTPATL